MPLTKKQKEYLLNCNRRWNIKTGATGSGKSFVDMAYTIPKRIISSHGEGLIVLIGNTRSTLERNILEPMRGIYPGLVGNIRADNTLYMFGKKVYALGADQKNRVSKIQGATFEYVYGDEITTWSEEVFQMLKSRLRCEHSHFDGTCNPDTPLHWFKKFLDSDADIYQQNYVIDDGVLPADTVRELKKEYAGTVYYKRYIEGLWAVAEGIIYPHYEDVILEPVEAPVSAYCVSMDYGTQNAFAALLWANRGGIWCAEKEYYYSGREQGWQKTDQEYLDDMLVFAQGLPAGKIDVIIDPSAASFIALLKRSGRFRPIPANNDVANGIRETNTAMAMGKIRISPECVNWKKEAEGYVWDNTSVEDRPVKMNDHCLTGDTLVFTSKGYRPISALVGLEGLVWSYNLETGEAELKPFHDVRKTREDVDVYKVKFVDGKEVKCTADHRFLTRFGEWVCPLDIITEDSCRAICEIGSDSGYDEVEKIKYYGREDVYNMEVDDNHNFAVNGGLIVHNCMDAMRYFVKTKNISKVVNPYYSPIERKIL